MWFRLGRFAKSVRDDKEVNADIVRGIIKLKDYEAIGFNPDEIDDIAYKVLTSCTVPQLPYEKDCKASKTVAHAGKKYTDFIFGGEKDGN